MYMQLENTTPRFVTYFLHFSFTIKAYNFISIVFIKKKKQQTFLYLLKYNHCYETSLKGFIYFINLYAPFNKKI